MAKLRVRMWSAMTRKAMSIFSCSDLETSGAGVPPVFEGVSPSNVFAGETPAAAAGTAAPLPGKVEPYFLPLSFSIRSKMGRKMSVS